MDFHLRKPDYKWVIAGACFLLVFTCLGFVCGNKGLYLAAVTEALGIKRSLYAFTDSFRYAASTVMSLCFGTLVYRFGTKKLVAAGFLSLIAACLVNACAEDVALFYVGGFLQGLGSAFTSSAMASSILRRWFHNDIGKITGLVFASNGLGSAVAAPIISALINEDGNPLGYRNAYLMFVPVLLVVGIVLMLLLKEKPANALSVEAPKKAKAPRNSAWAGIEFSQSRKKLYFYLTAASILLIGMTIQSTYASYAAHMRDVGLSAGSIAAIASAMALLFTASKFITGVLYDRFGLRILMLLSQGCAAVAFALLALLSIFPSVSITVIFAVVFAVALPLETLTVSLITGDFFGTVAYDKHLGFFTAMINIGFTVGAPLVNLCYDMLGTYVPVFWFYFALMLVLIVVFQFTISSAKREAALSK